MKLSLTFISAAILLLGCADSKEGPPLTVNDGTQLPSKRVVANQYEVFTMGRASVNCISALTSNSSIALELKQGQRVKLASQTTTTQLFNGKKWLHIYPVDKPGATCHIETAYLIPVPDYPKPSQ